MARKKVKLAYIQNDSARKIAFKKRKRGIMKKVRELSTLCDVTACAIVYGPYETKPEFWPPLPEAKRVLTHFKSLSKMEKHKKMVNQEDFLKQRVVKLKEKLNKQVKDNKERENTKLMFQCLAGQKDVNDLSFQNLGDLVWLIDGKIGAIRDRIQLLRRLPPVVLPLAPPSEPNLHSQNTPATTAAMETVHVEG